MGFATTLERWLLAAGPRQYSIHHFVEEHMHSLRIHAFTREQLCNIPQPRPAASGRG